MADWLDSRGLILNAKKTQVMIIQPPNHPPPDARILCCGTVQEVVESVRYLGLQIDNDLKWSSQIAHVERKVSQLVGAMWRGGKGLTLSARRTWLIALVRSHLTYASNSFQPSLSSAGMERLLCAFKSAVRAVCRVHLPTSTTPLLARLSLPNLSVTYREKVQLFVHRCLNGKASQLLIPMFTLASTSGAGTCSTTRGQASRLLIIPIESPKFLLSFYGAVLWNSLPASARGELRQSMFKLSLVAQRST